MLGRDDMVSLSGQTANLRKQNPRSLRFSGYNQTCMILPRISESLLTRDLCSGDNCKVSYQSSEGMHTRNRFHILRTLHF
jgi:hypothetical protein